MDNNEVLTPPAVTNIIATESSISDSARGYDERTASTAIKEEGEDLREAANETLNIILDIDLDGKIRWASPSWQEVVGSTLNSVQGKPIADLLLDQQKSVFTDAIRSLREDVSGSRVIRFQIDRAMIARLRTGIGDLAGKQEDGELSEVEDLINLEAQGIILYDHPTGAESHTMWMIRPSVQREVTIDLPDILVESLGDGAEMLAHHLTLLAEVGTLDPQHNPPPLPVLCRICERQITPWWFPKHTELCFQEHQAEADLQMAQEHLSEHRTSIVNVLDMLEAQARYKARSPSEESASPPPQAQYKGMPIGSSSPSPSGRDSPASPGGSRPPSGLSHHRARSFAVRRPLSRIVELILDLCDTALEISPPSIKERRLQDRGEIRTQSPQSEGRISQILQWESPSAGTLESERGLAILCNDTHNLTRTKVDAVMLFRRILEYSETIRTEYTTLVQDCIDAAMQKAAKIAAGDISSSESSDDDVPGGDDGEPVDSAEMLQAVDMAPPIPLVKAQKESDSDDTHRNRGISNVDSRRSTFASSYDGPSAMSIALRQGSTRSPSPRQDLERRNSSAISTRSNSPGPGRIYQPQPVPSSATLKPMDIPSTAESDAGVESDGSVRSSIRSMPRQTRSPSIEQSLSRVRSSKDRKRTSLILPQRTRSRSRQESPARDPSQPVSPLRTHKPRLPSGAISVSNDKSPISPTLQSSEFCSPEIPAHISHHRRQSSAASSELSRAALSPRLSIAAPPPKAVPPSIRDFEIVKPISKGAFGSVYLAKKKSTGDYYAIKALRKQDMVAKNQVANVKAERAILMFQGESDFVAKLYWTFPSKDYIFLVMEYLNGGDCASLVHSLGTLPEDWAKRYMAEVVQGVEHLHGREIVHRDLKPDNLLIDQRGHLKLTDFGLSRMGLIGRQKRALSNKNSGPVQQPDPLKQGPFQPRSISIASSRSTSFDVQGYQTPGNTPALTPVRPSSKGEPSYFSLSRDTSGSREHNTSGQNSELGEIENLHSSFKRMSMNDVQFDSSRYSPKDTFLKLDEAGHGESLSRVDSISSSYRGSTPPQVSSAMLPPPMALFDPDDSNRRFVGTPDYLAPETINGLGQDEMSDWWSFGCIMFEFLFGYPPFHAETPDQVFENILERRIAWPEDDDEEVSAEAKDLINRLICLDPAERLGANMGEHYSSGGEEIRKHPWFTDIDWQTLNETEASFVPAPENIEDTEYFDARGAVVNDFAQEFEDQANSPSTTPLADFERPHDALSKVRHQVNSIKRNLLPLHIPPHVRDNRTRRLSEPVAGDDFGQFSFKNLPVLEKANKDVIQKLRAEALQPHTRTAHSAHPTSYAPNPTGSPSPPSLDSSPVIGLPLRRAISVNRGNRSASPSNLSHTNSSPSRGSQPSSPLVQFSAGSIHERRKTSSGSSAPQNSSLQPNSFYEVPRLPTSQTLPSLSSSPVKHSKPDTIDEQAAVVGPSSSPRARSHTVGSSESETVNHRTAQHRKQRSQVIDLSPSSSDTEDPRQKALLRVQRRRQSSRRLSQITIGDAPVFRPLDLLVVEDHPVSRLVMERLLGKLRCRVIIVQDGAEAIRYAMSSVKFDMIMTEYRLPQVNGADLARMLRETKNANNHTPIVAVTGYLKELQTPHHFDAMIEKPASTGKLIEVMSRLCQWRPPPPGWTPSQSNLPPMQDRLPASGLRRETHAVEDSPTSTSTTSTYPSLPVFSTHGSSRTDSVSSAGVWTDTDSNKAEDLTIPLRHSGNGGERVSDWRSGLGISSKSDAGPPRISLTHIMPALSHQDSAPAALGSSNTDGSPTPRKQPSSEFIEAKKRLLADTRDRSDSGGDTGDDEDEEIGHLRRSRSRSPAKVQDASLLLPSKLSTAMLRTDSQNTVIGPAPMGPRSISPSQVAELEIPSEVAVHSTEQQQEHRGLTPPEIFPLDPGGDSKVFVMDAPAAAGGSATERELGSTPSVEHLTAKLLETKLEHQDEMVRLARSPTTAERPHHD